MLPPVPHITGLGERSLALEEEERMCRRTNVTRATPVHRPQRPAGSTHSSTRGLRPPEQLERPAGFPSSCSSIRGILQARILEWVTISFSRGSFRPRDRTLLLSHFSRVQLCATP